MFSAAEWSCAVTPRRQEVLRRHVAALQSEALRMRQRWDGEREANAAWARELWSARARIRQLLEEGAHEDCAAGVGAEAPRPMAAVPRHRTRGQEELDTLRAETAALAREVSAAAGDQIEQCRSLRGLRAEAQAARWQRSTHAAADARRRLVAECRAYKQELHTETQSAETLRRRAGELRSEICVAKGEALAASASGRARVASNEEEASVLRAELARTEHSALWAAQGPDAAARREALCTQLHGRATSLLANLHSFQAHTRELAESLSDVNRRDTVLRAHLEQVQQRAQALATGLAYPASACERLRSDISEQCERLASWEASLEHLAGSHHEASLEAAEALGTAYTQSLGL